MGDVLASLGAPATPVLPALAYLTPLILIWVRCRQQPRLTRPAFRFALALALACTLVAAAVWFANIGSSAHGALWAMVGAVALLAVVGISLGRLSAQNRDLGWKYHLDRLRVLDAALSASRDGVLVTATTTDVFGLQIVYANLAFEELTGYGTDEAMGQSPSMLYNQSPQADREIVQEALRAGKPGRFEVLARRKDGTQVWVEWNVVPVPGSPDGCSYRIAILRDTTERKRLEEQLCQAAKMEAVGRLAAGIAHDFNNLLLVIGGNADLLSENTQQRPDAKLVDEIRFATDRAGWLVRQLLTFSRPRPTTQEVIDLGLVVTDFAAILRRVLGTGIATEIDVPREPVLVEADRGQLEQVLMNLSVNARDAMPTGGRLRLTLRSVAGAARLEVTDTGCGMSEKVKARMFEPFFTTKGPVNGTGLGLATVQQVVNGCGGTITVESTVGAGTTFRIEMPRSELIAPALACASEEPVQLAAQPRHGSTILIAEDEPGVRTLSRAILEGRGYRVTVAADGAEAIALLDAGQTFDGLLTDMSMPGAGGSEVAARARALSPNIGIVFMSGYTEVYPSLPDSIFLAKPFSPDSLAAAVEQVLAARHGNDELPSPLELQSV